MAGPGETSLTRISPRIRQLQDRLMDSLPCDGAWECLSPAQREAILSIHRMRTASTDDSSEHGEGGGKGHRKGRGHGIPRFVRSRSYDDRLESETDDSGVRGVNGTSSGATSHNSHEDDSSDPGVKRGGRFAKAVSADRATRRDAKNEFHEMNNMKNMRKSEVTNGFGNVNKIISKQMNKASAMPAGPSNITLDCRNVQGEKRRRSRIDVNSPFREGSAERNLEAEPPRRAAPGSDSQQTRIGLTRRNILSETFESDSKLHSLKELKETASSEEYDSGVNFKNDDSMDEYVRDRQNGGCDFNNEFESDRTPRSDTTSPSLQRKRDRSTDRLRAKGDDLTARKASAERDPFGGWDRDDKNRSREREVRSALASTHPERPKATKPNGEPLKSNMKVGYGAKLNSSFDYRTNLNQDQLNKYSSNWNNMILNNDVPIKPSNAAALTPQAAGREARFAKNGSSGALVRSTGNLANKSAVAAQVKKGDPNNWMMAADPRRTPNASQERSAAGKKYVRSKSLDRKYLDEDTSEEESDFETRRRTDRVRRYQRANQDWEVGRPQGGDERGRQRLRESDSPRKPKAKSAWDLSGQYRNARDDFDEFEEVGFRTRSDFRNRWQSEDSDVTRHRKTSENSEFGRMQWNRRSCDFDLDFPGEDLDRKSGDKDFDRKRWYRRSCDLDLDFDLHQNRQRREVEFDTEWGRQTLENCDDFEPEFASGKGKRSRSRIAEQQLVSMEAPGKGKGRGDDKRRGDDEKGRRTRAEIESGRMTRLDDVDDRRLRLDDEPVRRVRMEDDNGRRTRLEEHYRSKTSMGHYGREKRERSRTPHLLRGKLRLLKSILSF